MGDHDCWGQCGCHRPPPLACGLFQQGLARPWGGRQETSGPCSVSQAAPPSPALSGLDLNALGISAPFTWSSCVQSPGPARLYNLSCEQSSCGPQTPGPMSPDPCCPFQRQERGISPACLLLSSSGPQAGHGCSPSSCLALRPGCPTPTHPTLPLGAGDPRALPASASAFQRSSCPFGSFTQKSCGGTDAAGAPCQATQCSWDSCLAMVTPTGPQTAESLCTVSRASPQAGLRQVCLACPLGPTTSLASEHVPP